jgi:hypothetical protein
VGQADRLKVGRLVTFYRANGKPVPAKITAVTAGHSGKATLKVLGENVVYTDVPRMISKGQYPSFTYKRPKRSGVAGTGLTVVSDSFNRPDNATLGNADTGQAWTENVGTWDIVGGKLQGTGATGRATVDAGTPHVDIFADITSVSAASREAGIVFRYVDENNYWWALVDDQTSTSICQKVVAGVPTDMGAFGTFTVPCRMRVRCAGPDIFVYVNESLVKTILGDSTHIAATKHGVAHNTSGTKVFDSFQVTEIDDPLFTGGTVVDAGGYRTHTFTANDTLTMVVPGTVEYLVVAGGGGGGMGNNRQGGGGGAGGLRTGSMRVTATQAITVGGGGAGAAVVNTQGVNGGDSSIAALVVATGGGGGSFGSNQGSAGGSGGGSGNQYTAAGGAGTAGQGFAGGAGSNAGGGGASRAGGGGGAGGVGTTPVDNGFGAGGPGLDSMISGSSTTYAAGGSGSTTGGAGTANSGNGGTGGGATGVTPGGNGGSGVVIVRYRL